MRNSQRRSPQSSLSSPTTSPDPRTRFWEMMANTPRLLRLVWQATPIWFLMNLGITLCGSLLPIAQLYVNKLIVDQVVANLTQPPTDAQWQWIVVLILLAMGLALSLEAMSQGKLYASQVLNDRFTLYANQVLLKQAARLDLAHYERSEFYDTLSRAQESGSNYPVRVLSTMTTLAGQLVTFAGLLTLLMRFSPIVLLLLLLTSLPAFGVGVNFSRRRFWMLRSQTQSGRLAEYLQKVLTQQDFVKEVRLFDLSTYLLGQWRTIRSEFNRESAALAKRQALVRLGIGAIANLGFYAAYGWVVVQTVQGRITVGDLTLYAGAFQQAQGVMQMILMNLATVYEQNLYVSQYFEFLSLSPQVVSPAHPKAFPVPIQQGLVLRHVTFRYPEAIAPTLEDLNLTVRPGESIALVGENGAGKTTLLKLLTRFYDLTEGEITIDGIPLSAFDLADLRRNVGVVFQDFARYHLSVQDNIGFGNLRERENLSRIEQAAMDAGANLLVEALEHRYQTLLGKTFTDSTELSGGQWQKIGLARAFMTPAQILILDEPTAALDAIAEYDLFQRFRQLTQGKTTFLVSHRFSTVRMADRIVVLEKGRIMEVGSHNELMQQNGLYARMFRLQAESYRDPL